MKNIITNDIALKPKGEDLLSYYSYAEKIQSVIQGYANNPEPLTIGKYSKRGAGKLAQANVSIPAPVVSVEEISNVNN